MIKQVLGEFVHLTGTSNLDVSGSHGGTVLVGGDYQGKNPDILHADWVTMKEGARINLDGSAANGGKAILWGNKGMDFHGEISTQAIGKTGDGGFVEISSPGQYHFAGHVNALSKMPDSCSS